MYKHKNDEIVALIFKEKHNQGLTYRGLAQMIGTDPKQLVNWKNGTHISLELADRALKALGVSVTIGKDNTQRHSFGKEMYPPKNGSIDEVLPIGCVVISKENPNQKEEYKSTKWEEVKGVWRRIK